MDLRKVMKGPARPAPTVPNFAVNRYSPVTDWNDDPFGADVFEPNPQYMQKKKPPPRPPPPKIPSKQPDVPAKPSHFIRKPTVLSTLLSRKNKTVNSQSANVNSQNLFVDFNSELDTSKMFPKCEPKNIQMGTLIDLSSPPSSPTFTTRSSSDGLSVDSFGSDATTSTTHPNVLNGGNASQAESGFEDDFDLFLNSRKNIPNDDTLEDFTVIDPFSPQTVIKAPCKKKQVLNKDPFDSFQSSAHVGLVMKGPTIIRAKPARPKPPDNSALLKTTFGNGFPVTTPMSINTTTPIQKINGHGDTFDSKPFIWDEEGSTAIDSSPPMPSIPPPPPPVDIDNDLGTEWPDGAFGNVVADVTEDLSDEPYAVALFDYFTDHPDDLNFSANSKIKLISRVDDQWLFGSVWSGSRGLFPSNYVDIKVPLPNEPLPTRTLLGTAVALYDFEPVQTGDLRFTNGDTILVMHKINDEWYYGECNGMKGQFPANYVQMV